MYSLDRPFRIRTRNHGDWFSTDGVMVAPNVEHYEYLPPLDGVRNPWPRTPLPDVQQYSLHEYGNRVGFWRVLEVLDHYQVRCSTTLNIGVLQHFPDIADARLKRDGPS